MLKAPLFRNGKSGTLSPSFSEAEKTKRKPKPRSGQSEIMKQNRIALTVRFSPEEKEKAELNAAESGITLSRFLAQAGSLNRLPISDEERQLLIKVVVALNKLGNNVNQLAATSNAARNGSEVAPDEAEIEKAGTDVQSLVAAIRKRMNI
jgi:hypothetical protein